ncbi:Putative ribonuclease H protein At1g65750 [Linum perenne]
MQEKTSEVEGACYRWHRPPEGMIKCNIDAAVFEERGMVGAGLSLRDWEGRVVAVKMLHRRSRAPVNECEAWALLEGLRWAEEYQLQRVIFQSDAKVVVDKLQGRQVDVREFRGWIRKCRDILVSHPLFSVVFVRRSTNMVAHSLARNSCSVPSPTIGLTSPSWLLESVNDVCLISTH